MSKLYFFRHAQASYGAKNYDQLSSKGELQSAELGKYLVEKDFQFDKIYVGPLERQKHTFEIVADLYKQNGKGLPAPIFLEELREHKGTSSMRKILPELMDTVPQVKAWYDEIKIHPEKSKRNTLLAFQYFMDEWTLGNIKIEGTQSWANFRSVVRQGLNKILEETKKGETIAAFTSGGTISSVTAEALQIQNEQRVGAMNFSVRNTSYTTFLYSQNKFNLLSFNELPHLKKELVTFV